MAQIISIVSGKGGSGKSLLTAVLGRALAREGKKVLLIDMDIFVRGLTVMLYSFKKTTPSDNNYATVSELLGIFEEDSASKPPIQIDNKILIERFFECDVLPAVRNVAYPLDYDDRNLSEEVFCETVVQSLLDKVLEGYDYIFMDCRAGMDSLVAAICKKSNIVISVAENDEIGRQTNSNLVKFIQYHKKIGVVYSILNKTSKISNYDDVKARSKERAEFSVLGIIPFDIEILENFGEDRFWSIITETLYFRSLIDVWNQLSRTESVIELSESKYKFPPVLFMNKMQGRYSLAERMLRVYSILFLASGAALWLIDNVRSEKLSSYEFVSLISMLLGVIAILFSTSGLLSSFKKKEK